jgi:hypothetical protein
MTSRELNIIITAKNLAGAAISGVKKELGGIGKTAVKGLGTASRNIQRGAAIGAAAIAFNVKAGIDSLAELAEVENATAAVLKSTGEAANVSAAHIRERAEALETMSTIDDKTIQAGQNMLLTFTKIRNEVGAGNDIFDQASETMLNLSVAMGTEPAKAAIQLGKALNDPIKGITALTRVGVAFTEEQKKEITRLVEHNDLLGAQKIILGELNTEFGGRARAFGKGPAADMRRFGDAVEGAQQALATAFLPLMAKASRAAQDFLGRPEVIQGIKDFGASVAGAFDEALDFVGTIDWGSVMAGLKTARDVAKTILDTFLKLPPWVKTAIITGWGLNKLTGGAVGSIVGQLGAGLIKGVLGMNAGVVNVRGAVVNVPGGGRGVGAPTGAPLAGPGAAGLSALGAPGLATLGAGIGGILAMYALPVLLKGPEGAGNVTTERTIGHDASGKPITVKLDQPTTAMFTGLMPSFQSSVEAAGGKIVDAGDANTTRVNEAGMRNAARIEERLREGQNAQRSANQTAYQAAQQRAAALQQKVQAQTNATLQQSGKLTDITSATRAVAAKNWSPTVVANLTASVTTTVSVDSVIRSVTSAYIASGKGQNLLGVI